MLKKIRTALALVFITCITLLFLDFTGTVHAYLGWMAKIQLLPAIMACNIAVVALLALLTFLFGRIYCSVICPLGVFQDIANWFGNKRKKNRFKFSPERFKTRTVILAVFAVLMALGIGVAVIIAPYSAYGRMATQILSPLYKLANNALAYISERMDSYTFYEVDVWIKGVGSLVLALLTFVVIGAIAFFKGRAYCNTVCPVGTLLGFVSRFSIFRPTIDNSKCIKCKKCERNCKSSCIDIAGGKIDYSRCVSCFDCIGNCPKQAISFKNRLAKTTNSVASHTTNNVAKDLAKNETNPAADNTEKPQVDESRRKFLGVATVLAAGTLAKIHAQDSTKVEDQGEGGLAPIKDKVAPQRFGKIFPPGSKGERHLKEHCTGCGLCISACPNDVLRPGILVKPESSYERGYCRPECNRCSSVCPAGAILPITLAEKSSTQIGHAVWQFDLCIVNKDHVECGNCARHCPTGAIQMVSPDPNNPDALKVPVVNTERCIGCGACENLCPARPVSAIYIEGHEVHRTI